MIVVDVSVAAQWFISDEQSEFVDSILARVQVEGAVVPAIFRWEIQSALLSAQRADRLTPDEVDESLDALRDLPIVVEPPGERIFSGSEVQLARHYGLTPYDAAYLALALERRTEIATTDTELYYAARDLGIAVDMGS